MTRSYKKTPFSGHTTSRSDKWYKQKQHRKERVAVKKLLKAGKFDLLKFELKPFNDWDSSKDGKSWLGDLLKTNSKLFKKLMRK